MKILVSAAEASSDVHGAELLKALRAEISSAGSQETIDAFGIGGPRLQGEGLRPILDARELLSMGFTELLGRLPRILGALRQMSETARAEKPDVAVVIDYPDFHFRLAKMLQAQGVPVVYYIPPKIWAWRKGRVKILRERFSRILCIFPFEEEFYRQARVSAKYVGNPLLDELPLGLTREEARSRLGIGERQKTLVLMPGSRPSELKYHLEIMLEAARDAAGILREKSVLSAQEKLVALVPLALTENRAHVQARVDEWMKATQGEPCLDLRLLQGQSPEALVASDAGVIKSGTSTLEAAILDCPHVVIYKTAPFSHFVADHVIRYRKPIGLVNLVQGWKAGDRYLVPEIIGKKVTPETLSGHIVELMLNASKRAEMKKDFQALRNCLSIQASPSRVAAREILEVARQKSVTAAQGAPREGYPPA